MPVLCIDNDNVYESDQLCRYERQRRNIERMERRVKCARIPKIFENDCFDDFNVTARNHDAVLAVRSLVKDSALGHGVFLWGPSGTGKTMLTSIFANEILKLGRNVMFLNVPDFMLGMRSSIRKDGMQELLQEVKDVEVLILDDLGTERITPWVNENIFMLLNYRCNNRLSTSITSNYNLDMLISRIATTDKDGNVDRTHGQRVASRIIRMCSIVEIMGEDKRLIDSIGQHQGKVINLSQAKR